MLEIIKSKLNNNRLEISDYELGLVEYQGTYYTLKHFNHPYFVIGSDALSKIELWIMYPNVVIDNKFIVFSREGYNIKDIFNKNKLLQEYRDNFIIIDDFHEINVSSTEYRNHLNKDLVLKEVEDYIKLNNLYEVK
jgi:nicotinic acid mononucleotide adenylyltransferase